MKAITYTEYGSPDVLHVDEVDTPSFKSDELLIRVRAAEVTKSDCELRSFNFSVSWFWLPLRFAMGVRRPRRPILGGYFCGDVEALGSNVEGFSAGQPVFGCAGLRLGTYGEFVALPASYTIVPKPTNMTYVEAAAVPLGGLNALHFLRLAKVVPGEHVLINGAGGSIGAHAVQIAKSMGAVVTGVDTTIKEQFVRKVGADTFIDYTQADFADSGDVYDVIFDMVPGSSYQACVNVLKPEGRYFCGNPRLSRMLRCALTNRFTRRTAGFAFAKETTEELTTLSTMIDAGKIRSIVDRVMTAEEIGEAHRLVESEQRIGAIVVAI